jgi:hypothetical protein
MARPCDCSEELGLEVQGYSYCSVFVSTTDVVFCTSFRNGPTRVVVLINGLLGLHKTVQLIDQQLFNLFQRML